MPTRPWRLIRSGAMSGAENMALDEALLEAVARGESAPVLRLYSWRRPTVSLGYAQRGTRDVDRDLCRFHGVEVVRRVTGGRAVLHDREATYAVISPERSHPFPGGILENYRVIATVLQRTLADFGLDAELAPARPTGRSGQGIGHRAICFAAPSAHELVYRGCKMTGGAQKRFRGAFLQHGSIPLNLDLPLLQQLLEGEGTAGDADPLDLEGRIGWLHRWIDRPVSLDELENRLIANFAEGLELELVEDAPTRTELERMQKLVPGRRDEPSRGETRSRSRGA